MPYLKLVVSFGRLKKSNFNYTVLQESTSRIRTEISNHLATISSIQQL